MIHMELRICASQAPFRTSPINSHITGMEPLIDDVRNHPSFIFFVPSTLQIASTLISSFKSNQVSILIRFFIAMSHR